MSKFNERFRFIKDSTNISINQMAKRLNVSPSTVCYYLKDRDPGTDMLLRIADEFNVTVNWLVGYYDGDKDIIAKENAVLRKQIESIKKILS